MFSQPKCFISYAWNSDSQIKSFVNYLSESLKNNGIETWYDLSDNSLPGSDIDKFINKIEIADFVIVIISDGYLKKINNPESRVFQEWQLIEKSLDKNGKIIPILYEADCYSRLPYKIRSLVLIMTTTKEDIMHLINTIYSKSEKSAPSTIQIESYSKKFQLVNSEDNNISSEELHRAALQYAAMFYPDIAWYANDSTNQIDRINDNTFLKIMDIHTENNVGENSNLTIETVYLEGFFEEKLKSILIVTNGYLSPKFKYMALYQYEKNDKTIHFIDNVDFRYILDILKENRKNLSGVSPNDTNKLKIRSIQFVNISDYDYMRSGLIDRAEIVTLKKEYIRALNTTSNLFNDSFYYLYFYIYSSTNSKLVITNHNDLPFKIVSNQSYNFELSVKKGNNEFFLLIKPEKVDEYHNLDIQIKNIDNNQEFNFRMGSFKIEDSIVPNLIFKSQTNILIKIDEIIKYNIQSSAGIIVTIIGQGGAGKSYLVDTLVRDTYERYSESVDILKINFQFDNIGNNKLLSNLLFFLIANLPFDVSYDWISTNKKVESIFPANALRLIRSLKREQSVNPTEIIDIIYDCKDKGGMLYPNSVYLKRKIIFIDDIHKLKDEALKTFRFILEYYSKNTSKIIFVLSGRINELDVDNQRFLQTNSQCFSLTNPDREDIIQSIMKTSKSLEKYVEKCIIDESYEDNIFSTRDFVKSLCSLNIKSQFEFNRKIIEFRDNIKRPQYLAECFSNLSLEETRLLNIIYICKIESVEVSIDDLVNSNYSINDIESLIFREFIILKLENLIPRHDLLLESFKFYYDVDIAKYFEQIYITTNDGKTKEKILMILINCKFPNRQKYFDLAYNLLLITFESKEYFRTLEIVRKMVQVLEIDRNQIIISTYDEANIQFIYATALNHCGSIYKSQVYFEGLLRLKKSEDEKTISLVYEAETEKLSLDYWLLKTEKLIYNLEKLQREITYSFTNSSHYEKALLNTYNRLMVTHLLLDNLEEAKKCFENAKKMSRDLNHPEYLGFALMDYAKGIYNNAPYEALDLLYEALDIFLETKEKRRYIDCKCEIAFLEVVLGIKSELFDLIEVSKELKSEGLYNLYAKSIIKISAIKLKKNINYSEMLIDDFGKFTAYNNDQRDPRKELILLNLDIIQNKFIGDDYYIAYEDRYDYNGKIGESYTKIIKHNSSANAHTQSIIWGYEVKNTTEPSYILDLRIW